MPECVYESGLESTRGRVDPDGSAPPPRINRGAIPLDGWRTFEGFIFGDFDLPANTATTTQVQRDRDWSKGGEMDAAVADVGTVHLLLHQTEHQLRVSAFDRTSSLHPHFSERVREALQFVLAYPVSWAATVLTHGNKRRVYVRGRRPASLHPRVQPPVPRNIERAEIITWQLFSVYLAYVCKNEADEVHRLSVEWNEVLRSNVSSLQTEALISSIAVESTCQYLDGLLGTDSAPLPEQSKNWAAIVDKVLKEEGCDKRTRARVAGNFKRMRRRDHTNLLRDLQKRGLVDPSLVEVWNDRRHIMAHGDREAQREFIKLYSACDALVTLIYQLYFYAIDYKGMYAYFATPGRPVRMYPPITRNYL